MLFFVEYEGSRKKLQCSTTEELLDNVRKHFNFKHSDKLIIQEFGKEENLFFDVDDFSLLGDRTRLNVVLQKGGETRPSHPTIPPIYKDNDVDMPGDNAEKPVASSFAESSVQNVGGTSQNYTQIKDESAVQGTNEAINYPLSRAFEMIDVIFCGNPGVGKSTLLSSTSKLQFESGFSWGAGLTAELTFKDNPNLPGVRFVDTPGLADINMAERASTAISSAFWNGAKQGTRALIFFVVTVESGRVKPDDLFTIKQVMGSIKLHNGERPVQNAYGVIVNKCTFLHSPNFNEVGKRKIESAFCVQSETVPFTTTYIHFIPNVSELVDESNCKYSFDGLIQWIFAFPGIKIASVDKIDVSSLEQKLRASKELHHKEMSALETKLEDQNKREFYEVQRRMDESRRDMQGKLREAETRAKKNKFCDFLREFIGTVATVTEVITNVFTPNIANRRDKKNY